MVIAFPLVVLFVLAAVRGWHRHTMWDWLLALSLLAYAPAILVYADISKESAGSAVVVLLIHCVAAVWFSKSRLLVAAMTPLAIYLALIAAIYVEMSVNDVWF